MIIDAHSHFYPGWYLELLKARSDPPRLIEDAEGLRFVMFPGEHGRRMDGDYWDLDRKLAFMDRFGITRTLLSLGNPWLDPFAGPDSVQIARRANQYFAALEGETDGKIIGLGVLPGSAVADAVLVAEEIARTPTLHGLISGTRVCGRRIDDSALDPLWETLEVTALPVLLHPHYTVAGEELTGYGHAFPVAMGFPFETTVALARLVFSGVLRRFPSLRIVASHGGGTIPFLAGRLDSAWKSDPSVQERLPYPPSRDLRRLYFDSVLFDVGALQATAQLAGTGRMPWGTDHPFSVADPATSLAAVREAFDQAGQGEVLGAGAERIFALAEGSEPAGPVT